ncbi:sensor histidine kinase [Enterovibrio paralichthyis]|uniref:sensor histidine kinase n=1 Tax=Enterovibrio paralichthyis TaxID=2853805 RepID=UPI001C43BA41|nr:HAMP domain-containing sensor histidine kinase [Enterovibrio paralichthyis]MBV7300023.1 HAMP domain-containing histidine kinase [Enterovibrio paralichthyis]
MFFADNYTLTRSSIFRTLIGLFLLIALVNVAVIRQVYINSEAFHQSQLAEQLNDEISEFKYAAQANRQEVEQLLAAKQTRERLFYYQLRDTPSVQTGEYPLHRLPQSNTQIPLAPDYHLEVRVDPAMMEAFRKALVPLVFSGSLLPIAVMLIAAFSFTVVIQRRLEQVNRAMNQFVCGENNVKLPVSRRDDEFDILAIHLNFMIEQMTKNEMTLRSLTTGLAHDMRTPMARLKLRLEQALESPSLPAPQAKTIGACHDELELLLSLFNSMLEIAKLNTLETDLDTELVDLGRVVSDALDFVQPLAEQKNQSLQLRMDQTCELFGDRSLLFRAVFNLIENAVKYTPVNGNIEVVVDRFGVVVADSGIGISDEDKMQVCKPMFRADKSRSEKGSGLGLALVDAVVTRHRANLLFRDNHPGLRARILLDPIRTHAINRQV